jgi:hypothetical protein
VHRQLADANGFRQAAETQLANDFFSETLLVHSHSEDAGNSIQSVLRDYSEDQLVALLKEQDGIERFGLRNPNYKIKKHSTLSEYHDALGTSNFGTCTSSPVCGIRGIEWCRIISSVRKLRKLGTGKDSER